MFTCGKRLFDRAEQIFVPLERQLGIHPALHQNLIAAESDRLFDLLKIVSSSST